MRVLPSLLAADVGNLEAEVRRAGQADADGLHIDIMDAHFVPNLSFGPAVVEMAARCGNLPLSVHLMMTQPDRYIPLFIQAGADSLLIHIEAACDVPRALREIRAAGIRAGITLNPETEAERIIPVLDRVDEVLCMSVHPGHGGQSFLAHVLPKIQTIRSMANNRGLGDLDILVDGGLTAVTAAACARQGANVFIAGTFLYGARNMAEAIRELRRCAAEALSA